MSNGIQNPRVDSIEFGQRIVVSDFLIQQEQCTDAFIHQLIISEVGPFEITLQSSLSQAGQTSNAEQEQEQEKLPHKITTYSRKQKSLSQLTRKFIQNFQGKINSLLLLDKVTQEMNVERRRIYDIINIMESLKVVGKVKKNVYQWKGLIEAVKTIKSIQNFQQVKQQYRIETKVKKERSLEALAGQFLRVFSTKKRVMTLQQASTYVLSEQYEQMRKTKIRRLYDIVNVFKCMGLIKKIKNQGYKPGYLWMGCQNLNQIIQQKRLKYSKVNSTMVEESEERQKINSEDEEDVQVKLQQSQINSHILAQVNKQEYFNDIKRLNQTYANMKPPKRAYIKKKQIQKNSLKLNKSNPQKKQIIQKSLKLSSFKTTLFENSENQKLPELQQQYKQFDNSNKYKQNKDRDRDRQCKNRILKQKLLKIQKKKQNKIPSKYINPNSSYLFSFISPWFNNKQLNIQQLVDKLKSAVFKLSNQQSYQEPKQHQNIKENQNQNYKENQNQKEEEKQKLQNIQNVQNIQDCIVKRQQEQQEEDQLQQEQQQEQQQQEEQEQQQEDQQQDSQQFQQNYPPIHRTYSDIVMEQQS